MTFNTESDKDKISCYKFLCAKIIKQARKDMKKKKFKEDCKYFFNSEWYEILKNFAIGDF